MQTTQKARNRYLVPAIAVIVIIVVGAAAGLYLETRAPASSSTTTTSTSGTSQVIQVVAAENFWGSLVSQLGGVHVNVTSIVSDPNTDPHEYESNPANAIAITNANFIIVNGAGYDTWALDIIAAENTPNQVVLNVQELINQSVDANPHFWYSPYYVNDTVAAMYKDLVKIDPTDTSYYHQQYATLNASLWQSYMSQEAVHQGELRRHHDLSARRVDGLLHRKVHAGGIHGEHLRLYGKRHGPPRRLSERVHGRGR